MDVKDLRCFLAVYKAGSFIGAASVLGTVHSNVSWRMRRLESLIGAPLFIRNHRRMQPTERGEKLHGIATRIVTEFENAERAIKVNRVA